MLVLLGAPALAQDAERAENPFFDMSLDELLDYRYEEDVLRPLRFYGFIRTNAEKVFAVPTVNARGQTVKASDPFEFSFPSFHLYGAADLSKRIDILFNIALDDTLLEVRNAYGNVQVHDAFQLRFGPQYRRFGLFNEKLDQSPTVIGIEPPELLDKDHLLLPRVALVSVHGELLEEGVVKYSLMTGNGEGGASANVLPLTWDLRYSGKAVVIGTSGHVSSVLGGADTATVGVGEGSPRGGILPWMAGDRYFVVGGFVEVGSKGLLVQTAHWHSEHSAERDPAAVLDVLANTDVSEVQLDNFLKPGADEAALTVEDVAVAAEYAVKTAYLRVGYTIPSKVGNWTPYAHYDWMRHPEVVADKEWGGDNESGVADDGGNFTKPSVGVVFNPVDEVALKVDGSTHIQQLNGRTEIYPEIRFDVSFSFKQKVK